MYKIRQPENLLDFFMVAGAALDLVEALRDCADELYQLHGQTHPDCPNDKRRRCPASYALWEAKDALQKAGILIPGTWPEIRNPDTQVTETK